MLLYCLVMCAVSTLLSGCTAGADPTTSQVEQRDAQKFWNSFGVNVHLYYDDSPYGDKAAVQQLLLELGIRHLRDGFELDRPEVYGAFNELEGIGIRSCLIVGEPGDDVLTQVRTISQTMASAVECIEGPNEYDRRGGSDWQFPLQDYQAQLNSTTKSDPELSKLPVLAPSSPGFEAINLADLSNIHPYPGGLEPSNDLSDNLEIARDQLGEAPIFATETGYHNAIAGDNSQPGVTEAQASVYIPRLFAEYFVRGIDRTYLYELIDQGPPASESQEDHFGLVRRDYSLKPAFRTLKALIEAVHDEKGAGTTPSLSYAIEGDRADVVSLPLRKSDGGHLLLLWRDEAVRPDGTSDAATVVVKLAERSRVIASSLLSPPASPITSDSIPVRIDGSVTILEVGAS